MNMKKTIAAVAAGAMAVSAMATSVSALENKTMTYNLVVHGMAANNGTVTITGSVLADLTESSGTIGVGLDTKGLGSDFVKYKTIEVTAIELGDDNQTVRRDTFKGSSDNGSENYVSTVEKGFLSMSVGGAGKSLNKANYRFTVTAVVEHKYSSIKTLNANINKVLVGTDDVSGDEFTLELTSNANNEVTANTFTATGGVYKSYDMPFKTSSTGNHNIVSYLEGRDEYIRENEFLLKDPTKADWSDGLQYNNVRAVLNDAVANYETVEFTFNTATKGIKWTTRGCAWESFTTPEIAKSHFSGFETSEGETHLWHNPTYNKDGTGYVNYTEGSEEIIGIYSDAADADTSYTTFANQLYNGWSNGNVTPWGGYYGGEAQTFYGYDFMQTNLFGAALIVNEGVTMSLADTDFFDYGTTSITFDWDAIYANGNTTPNAYATYIQTLKLMTSVDWYWDSMSVTVTLGEAEDAAAGAGAEGDEAELGDDEGSDEDISLDETEDKAPAEDEEPAEDETPADETPAPVQNPGRGNAPIALAVIPVALAAAAVVAKKRG